MCATRGERSVGTSSRSRSEKLVQLRRRRRRRRRARARARLRRRRPSLNRGASCELPRACFASESPSSRSPLNRLRPWAGIGVAAICVSRAQTQMLSRLAHFSSRVAAHPRLLWRSISSALALLSPCNVGSRPRAPSAKRASRQTMCSSAALTLTLGHRHTTT